MIGFNGTYLDKASLGNMRITSAAIGGQRVFHYEWTTHATQQAIIAAFGVEEGMAVISKTNDYLNAIATTDHGRAQQLAMFIDEDPLLVTSLVETSKVRTITGGNNAPYINTGIIPTKLPLKFKFKGSFDEVNSENCFTGTYYNGDYNNGFGFGVRNSKTFIYLNAAYSSFPVSPDTIYEMEYGITKDGWYLIKDGITQSGIKDASYILGVENHTIGLFTASSNGTYQTKSQTWVYLEAEINGEIYLFIPCHHNGAAGLLDVRHTTFYPNANTSGQFTIQLTDKSTNE